MTEKMLIDAAHSEETRVVVMHGNQIEEFDFESENKRPIRAISTSHKLPELSLHFRLLLLSMAAIDMGFLRSMKSIQIFTKSHFPTGKN